MEPSCRDSGVKPATATANAIAIATAYAFSVMNKISFVLLSSPPAVRVDAKKKPEVIIVPFRSEKAALRFAEAIRDALKKGWVISIRA